MLAKVPPGPENLSLRTRSFHLGQRIQHASARHPRDARCASDGGESAVDSVDTVFFDGVWGDILLALVEALLPYHDDGMTGAFRDHGERAARDARACLALMSKGRAPSGDFRSDSVTFFRLQRLADRSPIVSALVGYLSGARSDFSFSASTEHPAMRLARTAHRERPGLHVILDELGAILGTGPTLEAAWNVACSNAGDHGTAWIHVPPELAPASASTEETAKADLR